MKRKLCRLVRILCLAAALVAGILGWMHLNKLHQTRFPGLAAQSGGLGYLPLLWSGALFLLSPLFAALMGRLSGYQVVESRLLFVHITWGKQVRLGRPGFGTTMTPPRLDGTSPFLLPVLASPLYMGLVSLLSLALVPLFWGTGTVSLLMYLSFVFFALMLAGLLPRKNGSDALSFVLRGSRSRDLVRAWECALHVSQALRRGEKLAAMPEGWFQPYPADLADDPYVSNCMINGSSRLIRQQRFLQAYEMLQPLLTLQPGPDTHHLIACALLNGALCEALADLPPRCLNQLENPAVLYMLPAGWAPRAATARYARALFIDKDAVAAAEYLPAVEAAVAQDKSDAQLLHLLQEKAGIGGASA